MDTGTAIVATGVVITVGHWSKGEQISIRNVVGLGVGAISLAILQQMNPKFAEQWGVLILVLAVLMYLVPITKALGFEGTIARYTKK